MEKIFSAEIFFSESEMGFLAGYYLGRVKDLSLLKKVDENAIVRCKHNASIIISYMPEKMQKFFPELLDSILNDNEVMTNSERFIEIIFEKLKNFNDANSKT